jgi:hypothetical protein
MRPGKKKSGDNQRQKYTGWPEYFRAYSLARIAGRLRLHTNSANQKHRPQASVMCLAITETADLRTIIE